MQHSVVVNMPNSGDKSFGVPAKKVWKAHFHLTLSNVSSEELMKAAKIIGAKCTTIDLHRDTKSQRDRMLTKYQSDLDTTLMLQCVENLRMQVSMLFVTNWNECLNMLPVFFSWI